MISKSLVMMPIILSLLMIPFSPIFAAVDTLNTMNVEAVCGVDQVGNDLVFDNPLIGQVGVEQILQLKGSGSVDSELWAAGTNWVPEVGVDDTNVMDSELTKFLVDVPDTAYETAKIALNDLDFPETEVDMQYTLSNDGIVVNSYWQVKPVLNTGTFTGHLEQSMQIWGSC